MLEINQYIPTTVPLINEKGKEVTLKEYLGQPLVIYFYPKDDTPGCTLEAKQFSYLNRELIKLGVKVIGVSSDSVESHLRFKKKYGLLIELLSDPDHQLQTAFGVRREKRMLGETYMSTIRSTFAIDRKGKIIKIWPKVRPQAHADEVFQFTKDIAQKAH
jgi:peroxiredoxin Q/BCP